MPLPGPLRLFGKKHVQILSCWMGPATTYGCVAGATVLYFTDWKLVLQYLPFYNSKFVKNE